MKGARIVAKVAVLSLGVVLGAPPAFSYADSFDLSDSFSGRDATWHLSIGGGASIPLGGQVVVPVRVLEQGDPSFFYQVVFPELKGKLRQATVFEGRLTRRLTPSLEVGMLGGTSTEHRLAFLDFQADYTFPGFGTITLPSAANYAVKVSKAVPILSLGPWLQQGRLNYRPFLVAGVGWYYIDQQLWSANNQVLEWSRADQYSGALIGGGVTFGLSENGTLTLETRYEKVFSPGGTLTFLVPALHLGYLF